MSLGNPPLYSDRDRVVTITLKRASWSDGEPVIARDVVFWINLLKANRDDWASYVPGGFPDNVSAVKTLGGRSVRLTLNRSYNPVWFTNNELSQITPLQTVAQPPRPARRSRPIPIRRHRARAPSTAI
jgi:peptide/nickel transport system substrate-binding protein